MCTIFKVYPYGTRLNAADGTTCLTVSALSRPYCTACAVLSRCHLYCTTVSIDVFVPLWSWCRHAAAHDRLIIPFPPRCFPCPASLMAQPLCEGVRQRPADHGVPPFGAIGSRGHQSHASEQCLLAGAGKLIRVCVGKKTACRHFRVGITEYVMPRQQDYKQPCLCRWRCPTMTFACMLTAPRVLDPILLEVNHIF